MGTDTCDSARPRGGYVGGAEPLPRALEEVPNGELEYDGLLAGQRSEGDAPFEAQRADGGEPAEAEAPARAVRVVAVPRAAARIGRGVDAERAQLAVLVL